MKNIELDKTTLKVAIAGFMHDLGKLVEIDEKTRNDYDEKYKASETHILPNKNGNYTHKHALYTCLAIEDENFGFPKFLTSKDWGDGEPLVYMSARHHLNNNNGIDTFLTPYVNIIKEADCLSSKRERVNSEDYVYPKDYLSTRLISVLSEVELKNVEKNNGEINKENNIDSNSDDKYKFELNKMTPKSIFPQVLDKIEKDQAISDYEKLLEDFKKEVREKSNCVKGEGAERLWFEAFDSLWLKYACNIPEARARGNLKDTSLYDHSLATSAFSTALYLYHKKSETEKDPFKDLGKVDLSSKQEREKNKFILIAGDFFGIQNFIFGDFSGESNKNASKILRARSVMVSIYAELAASKICSELGLPHTSVIFNAGANFKILAPNIDEAKEKVKAIRKEINDWLKENFYGECYFGLTFVEASSNDFAESGSYRILNNRLHKEMDKEKNQKFEREDFGVFTDYLDKFENAQNVCSYCGKRPIKADGKCKICKDFESFGKEFVKNRYLVVVNKGYREDYGERLRESSKKQVSLIDVFEDFAICTVNIEQVIKDLLKCDFLYKVWDYGIYEDADTKSVASSAQDTNKVFVAKKFISGYVPKYKPIDEEDVRTFEAIAEEANLYEATGIKIKKENDDGPINALGVLKADVDDLGAIMACGLKDDRYTVSRMATLSRQLNFFFAYYLPYYLQNGGDSKDKELYKAVYTVFGGGDDLFLIGPWNVIIDLARDLSEKFKSYVGNNTFLHFSAGIFICKDNIPVPMMRYNVEEALNQSKDNTGKNALTVFNETVSFNKKDLKALDKFNDKVCELYNEGRISTSFLYSLNNYIRMSEDEKKLMSEDRCDIKSCECMRWKSHLAYQCTRNVKRKIGDVELSDEDIKELYGFLVDTISENRSKLRISLWTILYNIRGNR
ncbi:MAG: type III-A CRISPR-associated protein Cas10/Csm1 [Bdellovibrionota bacterium]